MLHCATRCVTRDECVKKTEKIFNDVAKKSKETMRNVNMLKEMINHIVKYFNKDKNWKNQQLIGTREVLRGVVVKSWVPMPLENMNFKKHNKILIQKLVNVGDRDSAC